MLGTGSIAADGAAGDRHPAAAGDSTASEVALVVANRAIRNGQRSGAIDPAAKARGKWISNTSEVVAHYAVRNRQRAAGVEDASAVALRNPDGAVRRSVVAYEAVHYRRCRATVVVIDASPGKLGIIAVDVAVEDCQGRVTSAAIVKDRTAIVRAIAS